MGRQERIMERLKDAHPVANPRGGTDCLVIGTSRPYIRVDGIQHRMARYILGIEDAGHLVLAMHKCDNPPCINPDHLEVGDYSRNNKDTWLRGPADGSRMKVL